MRSSLRSYLFSFAANWICVHIAPKFGAKSIRYVARHFRDWRGAASLCHRNRAEITILMCKQKPFSVWLLCRHEKLPCIVWTPIQYVTFLLRDRRGAASRRCRNRAKITVDMCQQKPYPVRLSWRHGKLSDIVWTPIPRYVTLHLRDGRGAASRLCRNRAKITVHMCEQKPYTVWLLCLRKSYLV